MIAAVSREAPDLIVAPTLKIAIPEEVWSRHRCLIDNNCSGLGVKDKERAMKAVMGAEGKRLTYRQPREAAHA